MTGFLTHREEHEPGAPTLQLHDVTVRYDGTPALDNVSLRIRGGEQIAVVGPNGAGKSTLFQVIAGIIKPNRGSVQIYGSVPNQHICVGYVPQRSGIDWRFPVSVRDVVLMGRVGKIGPLRRPKRADWARADAALEQVGMTDYAKRQIGELSGGQQQRVFLARALAQEAELLLLDEPLSGLDTPSQEAILRILGELRSNGITQMVATHDLNQAAAQFERMLLLNRFAIAYGAPAEVLTQENLLRAYGSQLHVVHTNGGEEMIVADSCCGGGHDPAPAHDWHSAAPTAGSPAAVRR